MAGQSRTLKLSILADVDQLKKSLASANGDVEDSSSKLGDFSKKAGLAFAAAAAAAGAYAIKLAVDGVKAAIEDEAAQVRLATALKNATGATDDMNLKITGKTKKYAHVIPTRNSRKLVITSGNTRFFSCKYKPGATKAHT